MPWGCFFHTGNTKNRGPQPNLPLWHHKTRKSHQNEPKAGAKRDPKPIKNLLKTSSGSKGCLWELPGQPRVTKMSPKVPKWPPRVPRIQVLESKTAPQNAIVTSRFPTIPRVAVRRHHSRNVGRHDEMQQRGLSTYVYASAQMQIDDTSASMLLDQENGQKIWTLKIAWFQRKLASL